MVLDKRQMCAIYVNDPPRWVFPTNGVYSALFVKKKSTNRFCSDKNNLNESYFAVFRIVAATRTCKIDKKTKNLIRGQIAGNLAFFPGG